MIQLAALIGLVVWGARIGRRRGGAWWVLPALPFVGFGAGAVGLGLTLFGLAHAWTAVEGVDAADKARVLSEGISRAMWATAVSLPIQALAYLGALGGCRDGARSA